MTLEKRTSSRTTAALTKKGAPSIAKAGGKKKVASADDAASRACVTPLERRSMIAQAAYLAAARRSFQGGSPEKDWLDAEAEVDALLMRVRGRNN